MLLLYGTANPVGYGDEDYNGIYLTDRDIDAITPTMAGIPVKVEHRGGNIGKVVSAWKHEGRMDLVLEIDPSTLDGAFGEEFVRRGMCKELSLGYNVQMSRGVDGKLSAGNKRVIEVSLVRKGARDNCHIRGWGKVHHQVFA